MTAVLLVFSFQFAQATRLRVDQTGPPFAATRISLDQLRPDGENCVAFEWRVLPDGEITPPRCLTARPARPIATAVTKEQFR